MREIVKNRKFVQVKKFSAKMKGKCFENPALRIAKSLCTIKTNNLQKILTKK